MSGCLLKPAPVHMYRRCQSRLSPAFLPPPPPPKRVPTPTVDDQGRARTEAETSPTGHASIADQLVPIGRGGKMALGMARWAVLSRS